MNAVDAQLAAYNRQDVEGFAACYTEDVVIEDATGQVLTTGKEALKARYAKLFADFPKNHADVLHRITVGEYVLDHERITGRAPEAIYAVAVYRMAGELIGHVRFIR
jgi:hypothetical protein